MVVPALLYALVIAAGPWSHGWGVPMATDTAFAIALIAVMGARVPVELRIFLTAAAIVDDIGAIVVVAVFYSGDIYPGYLAAAAAVIVALALLSRSRVYLLSPYILLGVALWTFVYAGGLHATLAGVVLALFIPTRPPADLAALMTQASTIIASEARHEGEVLRHGPSTPALHALDALYDRLESPADRLLRHAGARSSYAILPIFALANAGVTINPGVFVGHGWLMAAIAAGLAIGKPVGGRFNSVVNRVERVQRRCGGAVPKHLALMPGLGGDDCAGPRHQGGQVGGRPRRNEQRKYHAGQRSVEAARVYERPQRDA